MKYYSSAPYGLIVKDFDLKHTIESAQPLTFHANYNFAEGSISYPSGKQIINATVLGTNKSCKVKLNKENINFSRKEFIGRFRLNDDMAKIYKKISTDKFVSASIEKYYGMRLTLNDPWETTLCFIMSQYNNIKRITKIVRCFVSEFGSDILDADGKVIGKGFPTSEELTSFKEEDFKSCGAGFRAKYIAKAAEYCTNNLDLYKLKNHKYEKIKEELMVITGVGDKVADCIALMGYGKLEAFPIDVWVKRTLETVYFKGKTKKIDELHKFAEDEWGQYMGYTQQYIFHHGRNL